MEAQGLLYASPLTNYSKVTIKICNVDDPDLDCLSFNQISSLCGKGRLFLFLEVQDDQSPLGDLENYGENKFKLYNIFLIPLMYKRITVNYQVVKTKVEADYFYRFSE